jgi:hypothetical protein
MLHRTFSKSLPVLSLGLALILAAFAFSSTAVRSETSITSVPVSDWVGIYAIVDRVVIEPSEAAPERMQVWGAFAFSHPEDRRYYMPPERGYFYYSLTPGKADACRKEWRDIKAVAGTGEVIGFGDRNTLKGRLRKAAQKPESPDPYPIAWGLVKMSQRPSNYEPVLNLRSLPAPLSPLDGGEAKAGKVTLTARNAAQVWSNAVKYVFEIRALGSGEKETSPPLAAGAKETSWSPNLQIKADERYIWRVKLTDGQVTGSVASSEFRGIK